MPRKTATTMHRRSQSAMEYLMTYGWAILIIAVVLGALYSLGVFNMSAFMPKIGPGACHVFRPNGPGTSWNVALTGSCTGYLPQYVTQFNGQSSTMTTSRSISSGSNFTLVVWFLSKRSPTNQWPIIFGYFDTHRYPGIRIDNFGLGNVYLEWGNNPPTCDSSSYISLGSGAVPDRRWHQVIYTYNGVMVSAYFDGAGTGTVNTNMCLGTYTYTMSVGFNGSIANTQIYNASLTGAQVKYLYNEGIGGAPIYLQHLVGWWPLNGDTNDYSGNNNNGAPTAIAYNGSWTSGYFH